MTKQSGKIRKTHTHTTQLCPSNEQIASFLDARGHLLDLAPSEEWSLQSLEAVQYSFNPARRRRDCRGTAVQAQKPRLRGCRPAQNLVAIFFDNIIIIINALDSERSVETQLSWQQPQPPQCVLYSRSKDPLPEVRLGREPALSSLQHLACRSWRLVCFQAPGFIQFVKLRT